MTERCRAKNPATCRTHGAGRALDIINQCIDFGDILPAALFNVAAVKRAAENYDPENIATGMTVEYEDGTNDVFYGEADDPIHYSDWAFNSATDYLILKGYQYRDNDPANEYDDANEGLRTVREYAAEMNEMLVGHRPVFISGEDTEVGEKKVTRVTVV